MNKIDRIKELVETLNEAAKAYYQEDSEIMSNFTYDSLYDELCQLEKETGTVLSNSPTVKVGYEILSELPREAHPAPMLSLDKTKDRDALRDWLGDYDGILSWKMDGLTVVLTYDEGILKKAVTRGNGEVGEVITGNARVFKNIPTVISYKGPLSIRGEAVIKYSDFDKINQEIEDADAKYKNPRNLCSGSVRQLNNEITAKRNVHFFAFSMVETEDSVLELSFNNSFEKKYDFLKALGFNVVEYRRVSKDNIHENMDYFASRIKENDFPSDGLVLTYDDINYGKSLGRTAKFPRNAIAFKWADEEAETILREIEWSPSRTGLINPVAIFDSVQLEGTSVSRASVHNISIVRSLELGIGDTIKVYKANMIIPQISENLTRSASLIIPDTCPSCGGKTIIKNESGTETLNCENPECPAKNIKLFSLFVSRNAMNIEGLSEATLEKFIDLGYIRTLDDIYHLDKHQDEIVNLPGFGEKSYNNIIQSVDKSRECTLPGFIYGLGISNIGSANAKLLCKYYKNDLDAIIKADAAELSEIEHIGDVIAGFITDYFKKEENLLLIERLRKELTFKAYEMSDNQDLEGKIFVITGSLNHFSNRDELKDLIEKRGGKVTGSVTKNTTYLINNDINSNSSKNKKAKSLNVPIISEEDFLNLQ